MSENNQLVVMDDDDSPNYLDESDPRNLLNLVTKKIKESIERVTREVPQYLNIPELDLRDLLKPTETTDRIRISFWKEYFRAQEEGNRMRMRNVYSPVMTEAAFYNYVLPDNERMAWVLCAPADQMTTLLADLNYAKETESQILRMNLMDEHGELKIDAAKIWHKVYESAKNRAYGSVVQRIEQKTQSMHIRQNVGSTESSELKKELEALEAKHGDVKLLESGDE